MKTCAILLTALVGGIAAQNLADLPQCGVSQPQPFSFFLLPSLGDHGYLLTPKSTQPQQTCIDNMVNKGPDLGCAANDNGRASALCLCAQANFAYGIRDCSSQSCGSGTDVAGVLSYGAGYCEQGMFSFFPFVPPPLHCTFPSLSVCLSLHLALVLTTDRPVPWYTAASSASAAGSSSVSLAALSVFNGGAPAAPTASESASTDETSATTDSAVTTLTATLVSSSSSSSDETETASATTTDAMMNTTTATDGGGASNTMSDSSTSEATATTTTTAAAEMSTAAADEADVSTTAVTTVPVVSTMTSGDKVMTSTVGSSTVFSTVSSEGWAAHRAVVTGMAELGALVVAGAWIL